jgi:hypothetical protein
VTEVVPTTPNGVVDAMVSLLERTPGRCRVAIDSAPAAHPARLAEDLVAALAPRPSVHVAADHFWHPAGLRLENGRHDPDAWLHRWLDTRALQKEVLDASIDHGQVLTALRDPITDRSLRLAPVELPAGAVVVVSGSGLLDRGLTFDVTVHVHLSTGALARRTPEAEHWILPAIAAYEDEGRPDQRADLVVRADDARHPALVHGPAQP